MIGQHDPPVTIQSGNDYLLTPPEVCQLLRITDRTLYRWEARGEITPIRLPGNRRRFRMAEVERVMAGRVA